MKRLLPVIMLSMSLMAAAEKPYDANISNTTVLNPACPVTLTGLYANRPHRGSDLVSVHFKNQAEKRVIGVKIGVIGFDAVRDAHELPEQYAIALSLRPQHEAKPIFRINDDQLETELASGARIYLSKLVFSDGTTWQDDGTKSCSLSIEGIAPPDRWKDE